MKIKKGESITWEWQMYDVISTVTVQEIIFNKIKLIHWVHPKSLIEFNFKSLSPESTNVVIRQKGYQQSRNELLQTLTGSTGGFTAVLDRCKAYLEHGIDLNLIADKFQKEAI